jgi:hypothetical protein
MDTHSHLSSIKKVIWVCGSNREKSAAAEKDDKSSNPGIKKKRDGRDVLVKSLSFARFPDLVSVTLRAAAPIRAAAATPAATTTLSSTLALAGRGWANKSVVD